MKKYLTTFEYSKKLFDAGLKLESEFSWRRLKQRGGTEYYYEICHKEDISKLLMVDYVADKYPAYCLEQLMEVLPDAHLTGSFAIGNKCGVVYLGEAGEIIRSPIDRSCSVNEVADLILRYIDLKVIGITAAESNGSRGSTCQDI